MVFLPIMLKSLLQKGLRDLKKIKKIKTKTLLFYDVFILLFADKSAKGFAVNLTQEISLVADQKQPKVTLLIALILFSEFCQYLILATH